MSEKFVDRCLRFFFFYRGRLGWGGSGLSRYVSGDVCFDRGEEFYLRFSDIGGFMVYVVMFSRFFFRSSF